MDKLYKTFAFLSTLKNNLEIVNIIHTHNHIKTTEPSLNNVFKISMLNFMKSCLYPQAIPSSFPCRKLCASKMGSGPGHKPACKGKRGENTLCE